MPFPAMTLPLLLSLSSGDWLRDDRFPNDPLVGHFRVVQVYPSPLRLREPIIDVAQGLGDPLLRMHQRVSIEHIGESEYFDQPAQEYRFVFYRLPPSSDGEQAEHPLSAGQEDPRMTFTATAAVIGYPRSGHDYVGFGASPDDVAYIAAFGQPGPEARLYVTPQGDLVWQVFVNIKPEVQRHTTSLTITFRLKREA